MESNTDVHKQTTEKKTEDVSNKRGPYQKPPDRKSGKQSFLDEYVFDDKSIFSSWIMYDEKRDRLFCELCIESGEMKHNNWGNMTQGTNQFKKDACDKHVMSATHQKALKFIFSKSKNPSLEVFTSKPLVTSLSQNSNCIDMKKYNHYRNLFMNIYWCCKEELPILKSLLYIILPRRV